MCSILPKNPTKSKPQAPAKPLKSLTFLECVNVQGRGKDWKIFVGHCCRREASSRTRIQSAAGQE